MKMPPVLISIIDDDFALRTSLVDLMRSAGYRAEAFCCAQEFLDAKDRAEFRVIISDIQMPGLDGFELKRRLEAEGSTTPVILITARADMYTTDQFAAADAACVLRKPFAANDLFSCVERSLQS